MSDELRFDPPPDCDRDGCCDLSCVWPTHQDQDLRETEVMDSQLEATAPVDGDVHD
jgi:hypothetical protein